MRVLSPKHVVNPMEPISTMPTTNPSRVQPTAMTTTLSFLLAFLTFVAGLLTVVFLLQKNLSSFCGKMEQGVKNKKTSKDFYGVCFARVYSIYFWQVQKGAKWFLKGVNIPSLRVSLAASKVLVSDRNLAMHSLWAGCFPWQTVVVCFQALPEISEEWFFLGMFRGCQMGRRYAHL